MNKHQRLLPFEIVHLRKHAINIIILIIEVKKCHWQAIHYQLINADNQTECRFVVTNCAALPSFPISFYLDLIEFVIFIIFLGRTLWCWQFFGKYITLTNKHCGIVFVNTMCVWYKNRPHILCWHWRHPKIALRRFYWGSIFLFTGSRMTFFFLLRVNHNRRWCMSYNTRALLHSYINVQWNVWLALLWFLQLFRSPFY